MQQLTSNALNFLELNKNKKIVFTNGCFDILHVGHIRYLEAARVHGDALVVALNSDVSVRKFKGPRRPINNERDRAEILAALSFVDYILIFRSPSPLRVFQRFKPAIYAKGGDYTLETLNQRERVCLEKSNTRIVFIPLVRGYSTTSTMKRLKC